MLHSPPIGACLSRWPTSVVYRLCRCQVPQTLSELPIAGSELAGKITCHPRITARTGSCANDATRIRKSSWLSFWLRLEGTARISLFKDTSGSRKKESTCLSRPRRRPFRLKALFAPLLCFSDTESAAPHSSLGTVSALWFPLLSAASASFAWRCRLARGGW